MPHYNRHLVPLPNPFHRTVTCPRGWIPTLLPLSMDGIYCFTRRGKLSMSATKLQSPGETCMPRDRLASLQFPFSQVRGQQNGLRQRLSRLPLQLLHSSNVFILKCLGTANNPCCPQSWGHPLPRFYDRSVDTFPPNNNKTF